MSKHPGPRHPGTDEQGRPIVAELGRAETPEETAARKAAATEQHRGNNRSVLSLVFALVASFGIVAFLVLVVVRPDAGSMRDPVDYIAIAGAAESSMSDVDLLAPALPEGWYANRAELVTAAADGVTSWRIGLITADEGYLSLVQGLDANPSWVAELVANTPPGPSVRLGGVEWTSYDRREADAPGNLAFALVTTVDDTSTVVLSGTASDAEFAILAEAIAGELDS